MARTQNTARKVETEIGEAQAAPTKVETAKDKLGATAAKEKVRNIFDVDSIEHEISASVVEKTKLLTEVRQKLAEAADLAREGMDADAEAGSIADECGKRLFHGRINGLVSADEVSSTLGEIFGFRMKGDAKKRVDAGDKNASKTPFGLGEHIRKRVVRAVSASDFTETDDDGNFIGGDAGGRFFDGIDPEAIHPIVEALNSGDKSLWSAYDDMTKLKASLRNSVNAAFDPAKIAKIVETLEGDGAVEALASSIDLRKAYKSLVKMLHSIGVELAERGIED